MVKDGWLRNLVFREGDRVREVREIPLDLVVHNPFQPRKAMNEEELEELAGSIRTYGVLQPILVRPLGRGYELVAGERRLRACKRIGLKTIPALVRDLSDEETALVCLIENLQREDLGFFEEAEGYQQVMERFGLTQEELARRLGKGQSTIANKLRLLKLPADVREAVVRGGIGERHARALLRLTDDELQRRVVAEVAEHHLTVRETEELIETLLGTASGGDAGEAASDEGGRERKRKIVRVFKDVRLFLNAFRQAVDVLKKAGVAVRMTERDMGDHIEVYVRIPKSR